MLENARQRLPAKEYLDVAMLPFIFPFAATFGIYGVLLKTTVPGGTAFITAILPMSIWLGVLYARLWNRREEEVNRYRHYHDK